MLDQEQIFTKFISSTSLHGVHNLEDNSNKNVKILWGILIITSFCLCGWQMEDRIQAYLEYPTIRKVDIIHSKSLAFPAVTICFAHRYNNDTISDIDRKYINLQTWKLYSTINSLNISDEAKKLEDEIKLFYKGRTIDGQEIMLRTSFPLNNSTLKHCFVAEKTCFPEDFHFYFNKWYESCWTYNGVNSSKVQSAGVMDPLLGFRIVIDIKQGEYTSTLKFGLPKFIFSIHARNERLLQMENTFAPGLATFAAFTYQKDNYISTAKAECIKDHPNYSMISCLNECKSSLYSEHCGCKQQPFTDSEENIPICELSNSIICSNYTEETDKSIQAAECEHCILPCVEESFHTQISYGQIENDLDYLLELSTQFDEDPDYISKNYLILNVYYKTSTYTETTQILAIPISSLISDIGGQLGIFLGMSILTATEILQYFLKSIFHFFKNRCISKSKTHMVVTYVK